MGSSDFLGYCSFTKAIEHLGDRWTLFIVRELAVSGPQGFNDLATGLPGRISRSVLADRLRGLENLGLVVHSGGSPYRLTSAGNGLIPAMMSLRGVESYGCLRDPLMDETRYLYLQAAIPTLLAPARGRRDWAEALNDETLVVAGAPDLASRIAEWFTPVALADAPPR